MRLTHNVIHSLGGQVKNPLLIMNLGVFIEVKPSLLMQVRWAQR